MGLNKLVCAIERPHRLLNAFKHYYDGAFHQIENCNHLLVILEEQEHNHAHAHAHALVTELRAFLIDVSRAGNLQPDGCHLRHQLR